MVSVLHAVKDQRIQFYKPVQADITDTMFRTCQRETRRDELYMKQNTITYYRPSFRYSKPTPRATYLVNPLSIVIRNIRPFCFFFVLLI